MSSTLVRPALPTSRTGRLAVNPSKIARRLAEGTRLWNGVVEFDPHERWYTRIALERDWEAWLLSWLPGQGTVWHDHGGSAGAFTLLQGSLVERTAAVPAADAASGASPQIDPGTRTLDAGQLRAFGGRHLHRVTNEGTTPAVSLHVYAPGLHEMNDYAEAGDGRLVLVESRRAGVSW